jgi:hypothetical protein
MHHSGRTQAIVISCLLAIGCEMDVEPVRRADARADGAAMDANPPALPAPDASMDASPPRPDVPAPDATCASIEAMASVARRPLDVILVVDASSSFDRPRAAISATLARSLIEALQRAAVDYRVVVVGGAIAAPPATDPPRYFFVRSDHGSGGFNMRLPGILRLSLPNLRADSLKAVMVFTDDGSGVGDRAGFYSGMSAPDLAAYFGTMAAKRYTLHTIAGLAANMPSAVPWPPEAPPVTAECAGFSARPAVETQWLSKESGGYRFPLCNFMEYGGLFDAVAALAISGVRVPCEWDQPSLSDGRVPDFFSARATVRFGDGSTDELRPVRGEADCATGGFYRVPAPASDGGVAGGPTRGDRVRLCPASCDRVQRDDRATVRFRFECPPG